MGKAKAPASSAPAPSSGGKEKVKKHAKHEPGVPGPSGIKKVTASKPAAVPQPQATNGTGTKAKEKKAKQKSQGSEIDDIFSAGKKPAVNTQPVNGGKDASADQTTAKQAAKVQGNKDDIFGELVGKKRNKTEEGWNIYTEDELGLNRGGGDTELCPFDCDCCY